MTMETDIQTYIMNKVTKPRFMPTKIIITQGVCELVEQGQLDVAPYLQRHLTGDWGDLEDSTRRDNDAALKSGQNRLFSAYRFTTVRQLWVITEYGGRITTALLPSEY